MVCEKVLVREKRIHQLNAMMYELVKSKDKESNKKSTEKGKNGLETNVMNWKEVKVPMNLLILFPK